MDTNTVTPFFGQRVDRVPELTSCLGVNTRSRFVEQQQRWRMQVARVQCQPLFPAAGQGTGQLSSAIHQADSPERSLDHFMTWV